MCRWLGADHVFLADNDSADSEWITETLASESSASFLSVRRELAPKAQLKAYAWCAEEQRHRFNWIAFFDLDEFLVLRPPNDGGDAPALKSFLDEYKHEAGLIVNWILMGPSGRETRPSEGGVLASYTQCVTQPDRHLKTIANTFFIDGTALHPHNMEFRCGGGACFAHNATRNAVSAHVDVQNEQSCWRGGVGIDLIRVARRDAKLPVDEHHTTVDRQWFTRHQRFLPRGKTAWRGDRCKIAGGEAAPPADLETFCYITAAAMRPDAGTAERVALFHYGTKSAQDFRAKVERGSGLSQHAKGQDYFDGIQRSSPPPTLQRISNGLPIRTLLRFCTDVLFARPWVKLFAALPDSLMRELTCPMQSAAGRAHLPRARGHRAPVLRRGCSSAERIACACAGRSGGGNGGRSSTWQQ